MSFACMAKGLSSKKYEAKSSSGLADAPGHTFY